MIIFDSIFPTPDSRVPTPDSLFPFLNNKIIGNRTINRHNLKVT
ncbi:MULTISPECIES: hypothetical protein [unclassified Moorena]|nr:MULTISPECIES: hypothetical protein [unclassified Moorena]